MDEIISPGATRGFKGKNINIVNMQLIKYSEKLLIWLHRNNKSQKWLADKLFQTRQGIGQKIRDNNFNSFDKSRIAELGFKG